jgi:predicted Na+-dependent transporter
VARLDADDRFTLMIEFSVKNAGVAAIVASSARDRPEFAVFVGAYVVAAYPLLGLATWAFRRFAAPRERVAPPGARRRGSLDS